MPMKMEIDLDLEEDVGFYEQTIFSQVSEEADNLENVDVQETSAHEAESLKPVRLNEKFSLSVKFAFYQDVYVNEKDAYEAYRNYGQNLGFSVHKDHHSYWPNSRNLKSKDFVYSKADFKKLSDLNIQRKYRKSDTRTGCPAMIRFTVDEAGYWKVKKFIENHNHDLPRPDDRHLLRSCRNMCDEKAFVLKAMIDAGIRTIDAFSFLADEVGGVENIEFTRRDAYNFIQKIKRAKIELGDTNTLIELFKERQLNDNMFSWDVQKDEFDILLNFFWVDGIGKIEMTALVMW
ncbi:hypothetical protein KFK09_002494 [Dendrobium nobile]|uniref:FAR1 domain-containing protein n=1 Tax=Dendrobium nobile TaxID=94219 RepID=A0A8T3C1J3_DENNO|nr:hypothetical protein KFK09_002494 [Dendrobium nobile]